MTVNANDARVDLLGNGSNLQFTYDFKIFTKNDILVLVAGVTKTVDTDYTVAGVGADAGGSVTFVIAPGNNVAVTLLRKQPNDQGSNYVPNEDYPAERIEKDLDKLAMQMQEVREEIARAIKFTKESTNANKTMDALTAGKFPQVKGDGSGFQMASVVSAGQITVPVAIADGGTGATTAVGARDALLADEDSRTNTVKVVATQKATTTATPAAGIGTGEKFQAESADENPSDFGQIEFAASDVGAGSEDTYFQILLRVAGAALAAAYRFVATTAFRAIFTHANSADRTYTLPNNSGTVALTSDITTSSLLAGVTGLTLSNNGVDPTNDIDIAVGAAISGDAVIADRVFMSLASALIKQLDAAWAVGTNAGMRDTGAIADGWWHIFLIKRTDTGVVDVLASQSFSSPTMPTNYDKRKWIGAIERAAGVIRAFDQNGDDFLWDVVVSNVNTTNPGTSAVLSTVTSPGGIKTFPKLSVDLVAGAPLNVAALITSPDQADTAPSTSTAFSVVSGETAGTLQVGSSLDHVWTNTSSQIRYRLSASDATVIIRIVTHGWRVNRAEVR